MAQAILVRANFHLVCLGPVCSGQMTLAVYHKLWGTTANWAARKNFGWYQVYARLAPWSVAGGGAGAWFCFGWFSDDWKKTITLGIYEPPLTHWDTNMTNARSEFVKFHAEYPGIPYK